MKEFSRRQLLPEPEAKWEIEAVICKPSLGAAQVSGLGSPDCLYHSECCDTPEKSALVSPSVCRFGFHGYWASSCAGPL
jgi:hypothetical protein